MTAEKRSSTVSKTPISITAVSGAELESRGITSVTALAQDVPGVSLKSSGPGQTEFEIRGMTSSGGSSPTVGFYLDDAPLTAPAAAQNGKVVIDPDLYDLARVEVLRGPQGTLYGSGSMGGTIKVVTNQPNATAYDASAQTTLSGTQGAGFNHSEDAMVNIPLIQDVLALRVVGSEAQTSGWIDRIVAGDYPVSPDGVTRGDVQAAPVIADHKGVNNEDLDGGRISLLFKPTDRLTLTPYLFVQQIAQDGLNTFDSDPGTTAHYQPFDIKEPYSDRFVLYGLSTNYRFDGLDLTSATSDWVRHSAITQNESEELQLAFGLPSVYVADGGIGPAAITEYDISRQFSQEFRITSSGNTRFQWLIGAFYSDFESDYNLTSNVPGAAALFGTSNIISQVQPTKIQQEALFGEASYKVTPKLKATLGLRGYSYRSTVDTTVSGIVSSTGSDAVATNHGGESNSGVNPKFNLSYQADPQLLIYGTVAKGFRPGGGNQPVPVDPNSAVGSECLVALQALGKESAPAFYGPDSVWSYEVGEKTHFGSRLNVNADLYYEDWKGIQQTVPLSCGFPYTDNTGAAAVIGGELETSLRLMEGLIFSANTGYTDAYLTQNNLETGSYKGEKLQDAPRWTANSSIVYSHPINDKWTATWRAEYSFMGSRIDATYATNYLPAYSPINLRISVSDTKWTAALFVNNASNTRAYLSDSTSLSLNLPTFNRIATNQPVTAGMHLSYHF